MIGERENTEIHATSRHMKSRISSSSIKNLISSFDSLFDMLRQCACKKEREKTRVKLISPEGVSAFRVQREILIFSGIMEKPTI